MSKIIVKSSKIIDKRWSLTKEMRNIKCKGKQMNKLCDK